MEFEREYEEISPGSGASGRSKQMAQFTELLVVLAIVFLVAAVRGREVDVEVVVWLVLVFLFAVLGHQWRNRQKRDDANRPS